MRSNEIPGLTRSVANLPAPERLFLWAVRAWSAYHTDLPLVWWTLDRAFTQEKIHAALPPFHELMSALFAGLKRWPDIRCVRCLHLGTDEACLLSVFAYLQSDDERGARNALQTWVLRSAVRVVCEQASECIAIAAAAGLHFMPAQPIPSSVSFLNGRVRGAGADRSTG
jgi:hypothetical protein